MTMHTRWNVLIEDLGQTDLTEPNRPWPPIHRIGGLRLSYFEQLRSANASLEVLATQDPLTGVLNGRSYRDQGRPAMRC